MRQGVIRRFFGAEASCFPAIAKVQAARIVRGVKSADLFRELERAGWILDRVRGSHHVFIHPEKPGHISVPHPRKDLGKGLVRKLRRQAGLA